MCTKGIKRGYEKPKTKSAEQALNSLMALCARSEKSSGDAYRLMNRWGVERAAQEEILKRLINDKFINDERYAEAFIREKSRLNGWGKYKIQSMLSQKGISKDIIEDKIANLNTDEMNGKLIDLLKKRCRTTKYTTVYQLRDKLIRYGASLGYDFSTVNDAVREVITEITENNEDICEILDF